MSTVSPINTSSRVQLDTGGHGYRFKHLVGDYGLIVVFFDCLVFLSIGTTSFLTVSNLINVIRQSSSSALLPLG